MQLELNFHNYIGHTYTLPLARKVEIEKQMNISPKTGPEKRKVAQQAWLAKYGHAPDYLEQLQTEIDATSHWGVKAGEEIVIFGGRLICALVDTYLQFGKALKLKMRKHELRTYVQVGNLRTGKVEADWLWTRPMLGRGADGRVQATAKRIPTNQVVGAIPPYLKDDPLQEIKVLHEAKPFTARGEIECDAFAPEGFEESFWEVLDYCGQHVGVGCSRDMGFGRFSRKGGKRARGIVKIEEIVESMPMSV